MKRFFTSITCAFSLLALTNVRSQAQSFTVANDTVTATYTSGTQNYEDAVTNTSTNVNDSLTLKWAVIASNFPADWVAASGICDNNICYPMNSLWPSGAVKQSKKYPDGIGDFHLQTTLSSATTGGTYYVTVRLYNYYIPTDSATETYIISYTPTGIANVINYKDIALYPNPATTQTTLAFNLQQSSKVEIAAYDELGRLVYSLPAQQMATGKQQISIPTGNLSAGIYNVAIKTEYGTVTKRLSVAK